MIADAEAFLPAETGLFISDPYNQVSLASAAWLTLSSAFPSETADSPHPTLSHPETSDHSRRASIITSVMHSPL